MKQIFYILGFSLLLLSNVYAVYWNETDFLGRDSRKIRNKLVSFDTKDSAIELAFEFNVPFVAVPAHRSNDNLKKSIVSLVNLNLGSIAVAGVMVLFGSVTSFLWTLLFPKLKQIPNNNSTTSSTEPPDSTTSDIDDSTNETKGDGKSERTFGRNKFLKFIDLIDATVNPTACLQQYFCLLSEQSAINLAEGCATSSDKIIAGIFEAQWILDMIVSTAIHDAIRYGMSMGNCQQQFSKCGFERMDLQNLLKMFKLV